MSSLNQIEILNSVDELRASRSNPSVYKTEISSISSNLDKIAIVVEGKNDPGVYRVWMKQILPANIYKKINITKAGDKKSVLTALTSTLGTGHYKNNIYFIVDHDFNGNCDIIHDNLLVLNAYSIENYIFTKEMVFELLECNFYLEDDSIRDFLSNKYHDDLISFLPKISNLNFLIYYAVLHHEKPFQLKKEKQDFSKHLEITTESCDFKSGIEIIEKLIHNITPERIKEILNFHEIKEIFNSFENIHLFYRGKFIEGFFDKWISMLIEDSKSTRPNLLPEKPLETIKFNPSVQDLSFYASKVRIPSEIESFFNKHF